jgi:hypothetical protein
MKREGKLVNMDVSLPLEEILRPDSGRITNPKCIRSLNQSAMKRKKVLEKAQLEKEQIKQIEAVKAKWKGVLGEQAIENSD